MSSFESQHPRSRDGKFTEKAKSESSRASLDVGEQLICAYCETPIVDDGTGVLNHIDENGDINYAADMDHVALDDSHEVFNHEAQAHRLRPPRHCG